MSKTNRGGSEGFPRGEFPHIHENAAARAVAVAMAAVGGTVAVRAIPNEPVSVWEAQVWRLASEMPSETEDTFESLANELGLWGGFEPNAVLR
jgi:hypothetical protein